MKIIKRSIGNFSDHLTSEGNTYITITHMVEKDYLDGIIPTCRTQLGFKTRTDADHQTIIELWGTNSDSLKKIGMMFLEMAAEVGQEEN